MEQFGSIWALPWTNICCPLAAKFQFIAQLRWGAMAASSSDPKPTYPNYPEAWWSWCPKNHKIDCMSCRIMSDLSIFKSLFVPWLNILEFWWRFWTSADGGLHHVQKERGSEAATRLSHDVRRLHRLPGLWKPPRDILGLYCGEPLTCWHLSPVTLQRCISSHICVMTRWCCCLHQSWMQDFLHGILCGTYCCCSGHLQDWMSSQMSRLTCTTSVRPASVWNVMEHGSKITAVWSSSAGRNFSKTWNGFTASCYLRSYQIIRELWCAMGPFFLDVTLW